jgi:hypothetical protein
LKKEVISRCPICSNELTITRLHCPSCQIEINGEFSLSRLNYLTKEQIQFVELFLKNQGNIKAIEKDLNVSYPTVKKLLNEVLAAMGFEPNNEVMESTKSLQRQEILERLSRREITFEEANALLKDIR